jgi:hypothetical protein
MHVVALSELAGAMDAALGPIAGCVGATAYDLRLVLNAGLPAVVLVTDDAARAARAVADIERLGHRAVSCSRAEVVPSASMTSIRVVDLGREGIARAEAQPERLPYDDVLCLLRATHSTTTESVSQVTERKLRPGMALATGGLVMSKKTKREVRSSHEQRQQVLYLFRRSGEPPWILREREINYAGLGGALAPSAAMNFTTVIQRLRERCPAAAYDETLVRSRPIRGIPPGIEAVDVQAHLIAAHVARL